MKFSVIIPTYKDWDRLKKCINSLIDSVDKGFKYEIIIVDNAAQHRPPEIFKQFPKVRLIHEPQPGSYSARNSGANIASGEILAFTDSDCIPDKNWLTNAKHFFDQSDCDLIGGKIEIFQDDAKNKYGYLYDRFTAFPQYKHVPEGRGVTANLFVKKGVFFEAGRFNSTIKSGGDWDFTLRCTGLGYKMIYAENVRVLHPARNLITILKKQYRLACWGAINVRKKYGHSQLRILVSNLINWPGSRRDPLSGLLSSKERVIIFSIDLIKYFYRLIINGGLLLRLIDPNKVRE